MFPNLLFAGKTEHIPTPHFGTEGLYLRKQSVAPFNYSSEPNAHPQDQ